MLKLDLCFLAQRPWKPLLGSPLTTGFSQTVHERLGASWLGVDTAGGPEDKDALSSSAAPPGALTAAPPPPHQGGYSGTESQRHLQERTCLTEGLQKCAWAQRKGNLTGESESRALEPPQRGISDSKPFQSWCMGL